MSEPLIGPTAPAPQEDAPTPPGSARDGHLRRVMVAFWIVTVVTVQVGGVLYPPMQLQADLYVFGLWLGHAWAGWAAAVWASSRWANRPGKRVLFLATVLAWHAIGLSTVSEEPITRYVVMLGGYGLIQSILFRWVGIPSWTIRSLARKRAVSDDSDAIPDEPLVADNSRQFGIGDLIVITTCVAILITAGRAYVPVLAESFWWGLVAGEAILLLLAVIAVLAGLAGRPLTVFVSTVVGLTAAVGGAMLMDFLESVVSGGSWVVLWPIYAFLLAIFFFLMLAFSALSMTPMRTATD